MSSQRESATSSIWVAVDSVQLPDKKYFKIGEVAQLVGVEPHVLRYWQTQFPQVRPQKSRSGHRLYRRKDVETLLAVRELLHVQRFTIAGARQALRSLVRGERTGTPQPTTSRRGQTAARSSSATPALATSALATLGASAAAAPAEATRSESPQAEVVAAQAGPEESGRAVVAAIATGADKAHGQAVDVEPVNVQGLNDGQLQEALDFQLAARDGAVARVTVSSGDGEGAPARPAAGPRGRGGREQLGFGFVPHNRDALVLARREVSEMLALLDREDELAPQLRAPAAQKS